MTRTSGREVISTRQEKLAELAQSEPQGVLTTLMTSIGATFGAFWTNGCVKTVYRHAANP